MMYNGLTVAWHDSSNCSDNKATRALLSSSTHSGVRLLVKSLNGLAYEWFRLWQGQLDLHQIRCDALYIYT